MGSLPKRPWSMNQPSTAPGTETGRGPVGGMCLRPSFWKCSRVSDRGERPLAFSPWSLRLRASHTRA